MIKVITPTGGRQTCLDLLAIWLNRQTVERFHWIVVDDCIPRSTLPTIRDGITVTVINPKHIWEPGQNTQAESLKAAMDFVKDDDLLMVCEDDDWYSPDYIYTMAEMLTKAEMVGMTNSRYYHIGAGLLREMRNTAHCSLACTAMTQGAIDALRQVICRHSRRIDQMLWAHPYLPKLTTDKLVSVGIKGMPGRPGIGIGHQPAGQRADLRSLIGDDARLYDAR